VFCYSNSFRNYTSFFKFAKLFTNFVSSSNKTAGFFSTAITSIPSYYLFSLVEASICSNSLVVIIVVFVVKTTSYNSDNDSGQGRIKGSS